MGHQRTPESELPSESVRDLEIAVRDRVNDPKLGPRLRKNQKAWNEIVSSLDVLGDTEVAFDAYERDAPSKSGVGLRYLLLYGVLQALFMQKDALIHLCAALGGPTEEEILADTRIKSARDIRNRAAGHPTRKNQPKSEPPSTHQISRFSLRVHEFDMLSADATGKHWMETIDVIKLIHDQRAAVADKLKVLREKLDKDDQVAREAVRNDLLASVFPDSLDYALEKLWEATQGSPGRFEMGPAHLQAVKDVMAEFLRALERRGLDKNSYPGIQGWFSEIDHPIEELERFFNDGKPGTLHFKTAGIIATHVSNQVAELREMAASIDEEWRVDQGTP